MPGSDRGHAPPPLVPRNQEHHGHCPAGNITPHTPHRTFHACCVPPSQRRAGGPASRCEKTVKREHSTRRVSKRRTYRSTTGKVSFPVQSCVVSCTNVCLDTCSWIHASKHLIRSGYKLFPASIRTFGYGLDTIGYDRIRSDTCTQVCSNWNRVSHRLDTCIRFVQKHHFCT